MAKAKLTLGLCAVAGLACASSFSRQLDQWITWALVAGLGATVLYGIAWWVIGEWLLDWECRRTNPPAPVQEPRYRDVKEAGR